MDAQDMNRNTALIFAAGKGEQGIVAALLTHGANVNIQNHRGMTALMTAACSGSAQTGQELLNGGADLSLRNVEGETALSLAKKRNHADIISLLTGAGGHP